MKHLDNRSLEYQGFTLSLFHNSTLWISLSSWNIGTAMAPPALPHATAMPWLCQLPQKWVEQLLHFTRNLRPCWVRRGMHPTVKLWDGFAATWALPFYHPPLCLLEELNLLHSIEPLRGMHEPIDLQQAEGHMHWNSLTSFIYTLLHFLLCACLLKQCVYVQSYKHTIYAWNAINLCSI